jgi:hypothetical protein
VYHRNVGPWAGAGLLPITGLNLVGMVAAAVVALCAGVVLLRLGMRRAGG